MANTNYKYNFIFKVYENMFINKTGFSFEQEELDYVIIVTILAFILTLIAGLYKLIEKLIERINRNELRKVELKELNRYGYR